MNAAEREREALMNVKETKEDFTGQMDFCSLLILEARLWAGPGGPSAARRLEKRSRTLVNSFCGSAATRPCQPPLH